ERLSAMTDVCSASFALTCRWPAAYSSLRIAPAIFLRDLAGSRAGRPRPSDRANRTDAVPQNEWTSRLDSSRAARVESSVWDRQRKLRRLLLLQWRQETRAGPLPASLWHDFWQAITCTGPHIADR